MVQDHQNLCRTSCSSVPGGLAWGAMATPASSSETPVWPLLLLVSGIWVLTSSLLQPSVCQCCKPFYTVLTGALRLHRHFQILVIFLAWILLTHGGYVCMLLIPQLFMDSVAFFNSLLLALPLLLKLESFSLFPSFSANNPTYCLSFFSHCGPVSHKSLPSSVMRPLVPETSANISLEHLLFYSLFLHDTA